MVAGSNPVIPTFFALIYAMAITIHYGGILKSVDLIDQLVDEMIEVCHVNGWQYQIVDTRTHKNTDPNDPLPHLKGISFGNDESESVWFTFDSFGKLLSPMVAIFQQHEPDKTERLEHHAFTKTQSGGPEYHIKIVNILKYASAKFFSVWNINDESQYYETENQDYLEQSMALIDKSMAALNEAFEIHGDQIRGKSEIEIKDFIEKVLGKEAIDIKVIKLGEEEE